MSLQLGDIAPDFHADTTEGPIDFHAWLGSGWGVLFSHPKDFTPVCTTELGEAARLKPEFDKRNTKIIGLSVDPLGDHGKWAGDIEETQGQKVNFPMIADPDSKVSNLYGMNSSEFGPEAHGAFGVRDRPGQEGEADHHLSAVDRPQTSRKFCASSTACSSPPTIGCDAGKLEVRRRRHHRSVAVGRRRQEAVPERLEDAEAVSACGEAAGRVILPLCG